MTSRRPRILSGVQPSGKLHLGNYFGAIRQHIALQDEGECFFFIADYHALTTVQDPSKLRGLVQGVALDYLALGLDPEKTAFFRQSDVPEVTELAWVLSCVTNMGLLERAVSYKEKGWEKALAEKVGRPPSLIIDSAGGPDFAALVNGVAPGGRIVSYGATRGPIENLEMTRVFFKQIDVRGSTMGTDEEFRAMLRLVARERIRPVVDHVFPLSQAAEADRRLAQSEQMGKIVLNCRA